MTCISQSARVLKGSQVQQSPSTSATPLLQRKCDCGSKRFTGTGCTECGKLQRKLAVGTDDSPFEAEADRMAEQVSSADTPGAAGLATQIQRATAASSAGGGDAPASVGRVLAGSGSQLAPSLAQDMGRRFGHDFSRVRVHTGPDAERSAREVEALAYTVGDHIVFGAGSFAPSTQRGRRLLAHELTHVVQQNGAPPALQRKVSPALPSIRKLLDNPSEADVHQVLVQFKALDETDLRDTVRALEQDDKAYVERFLTHVSEADKVNEFETLRAVKNARVWKIETKNDKTLVTTEVVGSCSPDQFEQAAKAARTGMAWLGAAIRAVDAYIAAPSAQANAAAAEALKLHFHSTSADVVKHVRERLVRIRADIERAQQFSLECHTSAWDPYCKNAGAYAYPDKVVLCSSFFDESSTSKAEAIVHEMAHAQVGGLSITDRAYQSDRLLALLTTAEALTNAESYALLAQQLGTGAVQKSTAPRDTEEDCPAGWWALLQKAVAVAQRWNRNLQVALPGLTAASLKPGTQWGTYIGTTQADLDKATRAVDRVASELDSSISFECEPEGGGRCDSAATYWYAAGDLHVCPSWKNQATEEARAESLLAGLFGYAGGVGDDKRRNNYARLARENNAGWPVPSMAAILGGGKWSPDHIEIMVRPYLPKGERYFYAESGQNHQRLSDDLPNAQLAAPGPGQAHNFWFELDYIVDLGQQGRPLPFTAPELRAELVYVAAGAGASFSERHQDLRPVYKGDGFSLQTTIPHAFMRRIGTGGVMSMRFELRDPDSKVTRVYQDKLQLAVAPAAAGP